MPVRRSGRRCSGVTLVELLVAITLLGVIGSAAVAAIRMQAGIHRRVGARVTSAMQLHEAMVPLVADLALLSPASGDIPPAGASDSTLDMLATVASGYLCAISSTGTATLWLVSTAERGSGVAAGDSLYLHADGTWRGARVAAVSRVKLDGAPCDPALTGSTALRRISIDSTDLTWARAGMPVRAARRVRYTLYRATDGSTYLGLREWSHATGRLSSVQPIAGPFDPTASRFAYLDSTGSALAAPVATPTQIAAVQIRLEATVRGLPGWSDSTIVALRN